MNQSAAAKPNLVVSPVRIEIDCFSPYMIITNGIWLGDHPLIYALPLFLIQLLIITLTSRAVYVVIEPFGQSMVLAEILAGVLLGPSFVGSFFKSFQKQFFPPRSISTLSSMANFGLLFFVFMVGVEMDINVVKQMKKKVMAIGTISIAFPFTITLTVAYLARDYFIEQAKNSAFYIYLAVALSVTAFPVLARILTELRLLSSEIGRISLLSSFINDLFSWFLLGLVLAFTGAVKGEKDVTGMPAAFILLSSLAFVLFCIFLVQPALKLLVLKTPEGEPMSDLDLGVVIMGVMMAGCITDFIGIHCVFGAFVYGLVFPHEPHGTALVERLEYFVTGLLLPIYFCTTGFKTDLSKIIHLRPDTIAILVCIFILSSISKVIITTIISLHYFSMPLSEGLSLGFLMNSQGLAEVILLNIARDKDIIEPETFAIMAVMSILMTALMMPQVKAAYKPMRKLAKYKRRTLMGTKPDTELRMLACVHSSSNVPSLISLLDMSNPTKRSPIFVSALHLIELKGRESAIVLVHDTGSKSSTSGGCNINHNEAQAKHIISAFETYEQHAGGVSVKTLTAISPYATMYDDICTIAADNHSTIIILPFDKLQTVNGSMESDNLSIHTVNQNVLNHAPCSVAILIDRGLRTDRKASLYTTRRVVLLFFGGPDDREALSYAWRMAEHPSISLTMVRFIPGEEAAKAPSMSSPSFSGTNGLLQHSSVSNILNLEDDPDRMLDEEYITEFQMKNLCNERIEYVEKVVNNSEETVAAIRSMDCMHDMYMVGRSQGTSPLTAGLIEWAECPELGPIGDLLASKDFGETLSVLVVQQYTEAGVAGRGGEGGDAALRRSHCSSVSVKQTSRQRVRAEQHSTAQGFNSDQEHGG